MLQRLKLPALALSTSVAMTVSAMAQGQTTKDCALRDIAAITMIEDRGEAGDVPAERLGKAWVTMLEARSVCSEGRIGEALALYQSILELGPVASVGQVQSRYPD